MRNLRRWTRFSALNIAVLGTWLVHAQDLPVVRAKDLPTAQGVIRALEGSDYRDTRAKRWGAIDWLKMEVMDMQTRRLIKGDGDRVLKDYHKHFGIIQEEMERSPIGALGSGDKEIEAQWWRLVGHYRTDSAIRAVAVNAGGPGFRTYIEAKRDQERMRAVMHRAEEESRAMAESEKSSRSRKELLRSGSAVLVLASLIALPLFIWLKGGARSAERYTGPSPTDPLTYLEAGAPHRFAMVMGKVISAESKYRRDGPMELTLKVDEGGVVNEYAVPSDLPAGAGNTVGRAVLVREGMGTMVYCYQADQGMELYTREDRPWRRPIPIRRSLGWLLLPVLSWAACGAWTMITLSTANKLAALAIIGQMILTVVIARRAVKEFRGFIKGPEGSEAIYQQHFLPALKQTVQAQAVRALREHASR